MVTEQFPQSRYLRNDFMIAEFCHMKRHNQCFKVWQHVFANNLILTYLM